MLSYEFKLKQDSSIDPDPTLFTHVIWTYWF